MYLGLGLSLITLLPRKFDFVVLVNYTSVDEIYKQFKFISIELLLSMKAWGNAKLNRSFNSQED